MIIRFRKMKWRTPRRRSAAWITTGMENCRSKNLHHHLRHPPVREDLRTTTSGLRGEKAADRKGARAVVRSAVAKSAATKRSAAHGKALKRGDHRQSEPAGSSASAVQVYSAAKVRHQKLGRKAVLPTVPRLVLQVDRAAAARDPVQGLEPVLTPSGLSNTSSSSIQMATG